MTSSTPRRCGALVQSDGSVRWRVWAPNAAKVELVCGESVRPMTAKDDGFFEFASEDVRDGQRYAFRLDGGEPRPDPCSLAQPDGVHGPSAVFNPAAFRWNARDWKGISREQLVFYELHVGTFSPDGTFDGVIERLTELKDLGVTAIELMPVGQFPGGRGWGYDGVQPYAAQNTYGGPHGLQRLIDACHSHGLAIFLDVVYNHLGPEGNYLGEFGPYFTDRHRTPWGPAINFDGPDSDPVRDFILDNARMWLEEFRVDGLRLDAVHAIIDLGARHILLSLADAAEEVAGRTGRHVHLIAESDQNDPRLLLPTERGGHGLSAQWSDDFHHALHVFFTGERRGYYADYGGARQLAEVMGEPFLYAWSHSPYRRRKHGARPPDDLLGDRFVVCVQNHDQVGNRARGDRWASLLDDPRRLRLAACLMAFSPYTPLLFMGEEYGETNPFPYFCSFGDDGLVRAVREGRKREFPDSDWHCEVPDPHDEATFESARLSWSWPEGSPRAGLRRLYRDLLAVRRTWPALRDRHRRPACLLPDADAGLVLEMTRGETQPVRCLFNLSDATQQITMRDSERMLFASEWARYAGSRRESQAVADLLPFECAAFGRDSEFGATR